MSEGRSIRAFQEGLENGSGFHGGEEEDACYDGDGGFSGSELVFGRWALRAAASVGRNPSVGLEAQ
jgi:hypothetical protein